jgi:abhydrolase domain-containing protein 12
VQPLYDNELRFESDRHIGKIACPVMILHAEDDNVVPFALGEKVFKILFYFLNLQIWIIN